MIPRLFAFPFIRIPCLFLAGFTAEAAPPNDNFANALPLTTSSEAVLDFEEAGLEPFEDGLSSENRNYPSVWFTWEAPAGGWFEIRSNSANRNIGYALFAGTAPANLQVVADADMTGHYWAFEDAPLFPSTGIRFQAAAGAVYRLRVYRFSSYGLVAAPTVGIFPASAPLARVVSLELPATAMFTGTETTVPVRLRIVSSKKYEGGVLSTLIGAATNDTTATPFGADQRIAGDAFDGTYLVRPPVWCRFCTHFRGPGENPEPLIWSIRNVLLFTADWRTNLSQGMPGNIPWPAGTRSRVPLVNQLPDDVEPPEVAAVEVTPVDPARNRYRVRLRLRDSGFGVLYGSVVLRNVNGLGSGYAVDLTNDPAQGTVHDGWYDVVLDGSFAPPGHYAVEIGAVDGAGNSVNTRSNAAGFPGPFHGEIPWRPELVPQLHEFSVSAPLVDVSGTASSVTLTVVISDPGRPVGAAGISFMPQGTAPFTGQRLEFGPPVLSVEGVDRRYRYEGTLVIPRYSEPGNYRLSFFAEIDGLWELVFGDGGVAVPGGTPSLEIRNEGTIDQQAPVVEIISAEPVTPWSPAAMAGLKVRLRIQDQLQPLVDLTAPLRGTLVQLVLRAAGGEAYLGPVAQVFPAHRVSGDAFDGIYELILRCASSGTVRIGVSLRSNATWSASDPDPVYYLPKEANPWQVWAEAWQLSAGESLPGADPDNDGLTNLQEYAFGLSPVRNGPGMNSVSPDPRLSRYPRSGLYPESFGFAFHTFAQPADAGIRIIPEFSSDLTNWLPIPRFDDYLPGLDGAQAFKTRTVFAPLPEASRSPRYFRLRVETLPP